MYRLSRGPLVFVAALAVLTAGCKSGNPAAPTPGSIVAPGLVSPSSGSVLAYATLPAKLVVSNSTVTSGATPTYTFEVAYDAGFSSKIATITGVTQGTTGQTTAVVSALLANNVYYWHARADVGSTSGAFSSTYSFSVGAQVSLSTPTPVNPANQSTVTPTPTLTVADVVKTGPAGAVTYKFDIADSSAFTNIVSTGTVSEAASQTSFTSGALTVGKTYYWRATASDATNGVTSAASTTQSFTTTTPSVAAQLAAQQGLQLWTGASPSGSPGQATLGNNWQLQTITYLTGTTFTSPGLEEMRVFDLIDHGYTPQAAVNFMLANGYPSTAIVVPEGGSIVAIGFTYDYMANSYGPWDLTIRSGS